MRANGGVTISNPICTNRNVAPKHSLHGSRSLGRASRIPRASRSRRASRNPRASRSRRASRNPRASRAPILG
jgi:hypothetical protein